METRAKEIQDKNDALVQRLRDKFVGHTFELKSTYDPINFQVKLTLLMDNKQTSIKFNSELRDDILTGFCDPVFGAGKRCTQELVDGVENELFGLLSYAVEQEFSKV